MLVSRLALIAVLVLPLTGFMASSGRVADPVAGQQEIDAAMGTIKRSLKSLQDSAEDKDKLDQSLASVLELEAALEVCKKAVPGKAADLEGKAREKMLREYRLMIIEVLKTSLDLEAALVDGKLPKAKKLVNQIAAFEGKGHGKFKDGK